METKSRLSVATAVIVAICCAPMSSSFVAVEAAEGLCCWWPKNANSASMCTSWSPSDNWCAVSESKCDHCGGNWVTDGNNNQPTTSSTTTTTNRPTTSSTTTITTTTTTTTTTPTQTQTQGGKL